MSHSDMGDLQGGAAPLFNRSMKRSAVLASLSILAASAHAAPPARVVSVGGAVTEIVYALGAGERLVATDSTSTWPEAARALPRVGYMRSLATEGVLAMRPDAVLLTSEAGPPATIAQLKMTRVPLTSLRADHSLDSLRASVKTVAAALEAPDRGAALDAKIVAEWEATQRSLTQYARQPRVLFLLAHTSNAAMVSGRGTAADAMIGLARATNAVTGFSGYKPLTAEAAIAAAPDVILVTSEGLEAVGGIDALLAKPGLALTPAGKAKRVVALDALYLLGFGPRLPQAVRDLAGALHDKP